MTETRTDIDALAARAQTLRPWRYDHFVGDRMVIAGNPESAPVHGSYGRGAEIMQHIVRRLGTMSNLDTCRALDLGCLEGHYTDILCAAGFKEVIAVDLSSAHLERARFLLKDVRGYDNVTLIEGSVADRSLIERIGPVDVILFHGLLYHMTDPVSVMRMLSQLAKPDHVLLMSTQFKFDFADIVSEAPLANIKFRREQGSDVVQTSVGSTYAPHAVRLNPCAIQRLLACAGYSEIVGYDTPLGSRYGFQLHVVAGAGRQRSLLEVLSRDVAVSGLAFYSYDGSRIDGVDFGHDLAPRLSRFLSRLSHFVGERIGSSGARQAARHSIPQRRAD